jgi:Leucine-rich repeat (LRR) protein
LFFAVVAVICGFAAWLGYEARTAKRELVAVDLISRSGGVVYYNYEVDAQSDAATFHKEQQHSRSVTDKYVCDHFSDEIHFVDLRDCSLVDLACLGDLRRAKWIDLRNTKYDHLPALKGLRVEYLFLPGSRVRSLDSISDSEALKWLIIDDTPVSDISPLSRCKSLETVSCCRTRITDIAPLAHLEGLTELAIDDNPVEIIDPLKSCMALRTLSLNGVPFRDISALSALQQLEELNLERTHLSSIGALRGCTSLRRLNLRGASIDEFRGLCHLLQLRELDLSRSNANDHDVEMLKGCLPNCRIQF